VAVVALSLLPSSTKHILQTSWLSGWHSASCWGHTVFRS